MLETRLLVLLGIMKNNSSMALRDLVCHLDLKNKKNYTLCSLCSAFLSFQQACDIALILISCSLNLPRILELIYLPPLNI